MNDFIPYEIIEGDYDKGMVLLADHAMNLLPAHYGKLGLPQTAFHRHIAFDIGIEGLTRSLAARLGVPAVLGRFSRLLIDPNRGEDDPTLIMKISDGAIIPGNHPISDDEWQRRIEFFHRPYHNAVDRVLTGVAQSSGKRRLFCRCIRTRRSGKKHRVPGMRRFCGTRIIVRSIRFWRICARPATFSLVTTNPMTGR